MSDDELLAGIAEVIREDDRPDPRLVALSEGRLSAQDLRTLEAEAARDPELARKVAVFRPLCDEFVERVEEAASVATKSHLRWVAAVATVAAIAAGLALVQLPMATEHAADLPIYMVAVQAGDAPVRGTAHDVGPSPRRMRADSEFGLVLRPVERVDAPIEARALVLDRSSGVARLTRTLQPAVEARGAATIRGPIGEITGVREGPVSVVLAVGLRGALPSDETLLKVEQEAGAIGREDWYAARIDVVIRRVEKD